MNYRNFFNMHMSFLLDLPNSPKKKKIVCMSLKKKISIFAISGHVNLFSFYDSACSFNERLTAQHSNAFKNINYYCCALNN